MVRKLMLYCIAGCGICSLTLSEATPILEAQVSRIYQELKLKNQNGKSKLRKQKSTQACRKTIIQA
jgi:hypothetical protein